MTPDDPRHGTNAGYIAHTKEAGGSSACEPCRVAAAEYERRRVTDVILRKPRVIPATGTARRIRALVAIGWPMHQLSVAIGLDGRDGIWHLTRNPTVTRRNAERVAALYDEICMTPGPSAIAKSRAIKSGWAPPLAWDNIDDPDEQPTGVGHKPFRVVDTATANEFDPTVVDRVLSGDWHLDATPAERAAVVTRWTAGGGSLNELERYTGWRTARYTKRDAA